MVDEEVVGSIATGDLTPSPEEGRQTEDAGGVQTVATEEQPTYDLEDEASVEKLLDEHPKVKAVHGRRLKSEHDGVENKWKPEVDKAKHEAQAYLGLLNADDRLKAAQEAESYRHKAEIIRLIRSDDTGDDLALIEKLDPLLSRTYLAQRERLLKGERVDGADGLYALLYQKAQLDVNGLLMQGGQRVHTFTEAEKKAGDDKYGPDYSEHLFRTVYNKGRRDGRDELDAELKAKAEKANSEAIKRQGTPTAVNGTAPGRRPTAAQYASVSMEQRDKWRREGIEPLI